MSAAPRRSLRLALRAPPPPPVLCLSSSPELLRTRLFRRCSQKARSSRRKLNFDLLSSNSSYSSLPSCLQGAVVTEELRKRMKRPLFASLECATPGQSCYTAAEDFKDVVEAYKRRRQSRLHVNRKKGSDFVGEVNNNGSMGAKHENVSEESPIGNSINAGDKSAVHKQDGVNCDRDVRNVGEKHNVKANLAGSRFRKQRYGRLGKKRATAELEVKDGGLGETSLPLIPAHGSGLGTTMLSQTLIDAPILYEGPFPSFTRPSPYECAEVKERLEKLHGPLEEFVKHKVARSSASQVVALENKMRGWDKAEHNAATLNGQTVVGNGSKMERHTVLDALIATILSQNTSDRNSRRAFTSLKQGFPTWEQVLAADPDDVKDAVKCGGLAEVKVPRVLNILSILQKEQGKLCLEYVRTMNSDKIKLELSRFKGVGPKTIACVLMFHLQHDEFPVDTHVFHISKMLGWVPANADREKAYLHLNSRIPNQWKFDLHCLLVTHGRRCPQCAKDGRTQRPLDGPCPLVSLRY